MNLIENGRLVDHLCDALSRGESGLRNIPMLMRRILADGLWRERQIRTKNIVKFDRFADFVTTAPLEGLGEDVDMLRRLLKEDPETLAMFEEAITGKNGVRRNSPSNNVTSSERGNGQPYTLRRLKKSAPELFERVTAGELSANQAAIEAGFRKKTLTIELTGKGLGRAYKKLSDEERNKFWALVK